MVFFSYFIPLNLDFICKRHKNAEIKFLVAEDTWYVEKKGKNSMIKYKKKQTNEADTSTDWNNEKKKEVQTNGIADKNQMNIIFV